MISPLTFFKHERALFLKGAYNLEFDPTTQWNFHRRMAWFWFLTFVPTVALMIFDVTAAFGVFPTMMVLVLNGVILSWNTICSWYANVATELDAISAAYAAIKSDEAAKNTGVK